VEHLCQAETAFKANVLKEHAYLILLITTKKTNVSLETVFTASLDHIKPTVIYVIKEIL